MMLWYIIKYINPQYFTCALCSKYRGELISELPESVKAYVPEVKSQSIQRRVLNKIQNKLFNRSQNSNQYKEFIINAQKEFKADVWYINTVLCPEAVELAIELKIPYVVHFHDLLFLYQHISYSALKNAVETAQLLVGCSQIVCDKLQIMGGGNIALQYECVDISKIIVNVDNTKELRIKYNLNNSFVWIMSGTIEYRKGTDFIASIAKKLGGSITLLWLGPGSSGYSYYVDQEIKFHGLTNVHMLGPKSKDYYDYLSLADGLVLTSREDPFPLVMIEAAAMGKPIVAFNSGGVNEFIQDGMGKVVSLGDVDELVAAMQGIMDNKIRFSEHEAIVRANEFDAQTQVILWQEMMLSEMKSFINME